MGTLQLAEPLLYHNLVHPHLGLPDHFMTPTKAADIPLRGPNKLLTLIQAAVISCDPAIDLISYIVHSYIGSSCCLKYMAYTVRSYQQHQQPKLTERAYSRFSEESAGQEMRLKGVEIQTSYARVLSNIHLKAVYVNKETNELVYNSRLMVKDRKYFITWCGMHLILIRDDDGVAIYTREEDDE